MPAGWTRWILEQFDFPFERVFAPFVRLEESRSPETGGIGRGGEAGRAGL